ncbi:transposase [Luteibacter sp. Sphag1AF]|nr:transposase [Luteibacter sp. Sphag1AF]
MTQVHRHVIESGILARVRWPMHTGQFEGINNRIKVMTRMACGYRMSRTS